MYRTPAANVLASRAVVMRPWSRAVLPNQSAAKFSKLVTTWLNLSYTTLRNRMFILVTVQSLGLVCRVWKTEVQSVLRPRKVGNYVSTERTDCFQSLLPRRLLTNVDLTLNQTDLVKFAASLVGATYGTSELTLGQFYCLSLSNMCITSQIHALIRCLAGTNLLKAWWENVTIKPNACWRWNTESWLHLQKSAVNLRFTMQHRTNGICQLLWLQVILIHFVRSILEKLFCSKTCAYTPLETQVEDMKIGHCLEQELN